MLFEVCSLLLFVSVSRPGRTVRTGADGGRIRPVETFSVLHAVCTLPARVQKKTTSKKPGQPGQPGQIFGQIFGQPGQPGQISRRRPYANAQVARLFRTVADDPQVVNLLIVRENAGTLQGVQRRF